MEDEADTLRREISHFAALLAVLAHDAPEADELAALLREHLAMTALYGPTLCALRLLCWLSDARKFIRGGERVAQITVVGSLTKAMWADAGSFAVIVVDEEEKLDLDGRRSRVNAEQVKVLKTARLLDIPVFLTKLNVNDTQERPFDGTYNPNLDKHIPTGPKGAVVVGKNGNTTPPGEFWVCVSRTEATNVVVMGQSTNACVKQTASGAVGQNPSLNVHTHQDLLRDALGSGDSLIIRSQWESSAHQGPGTYSVYTQV